MKRTRVQAAVLVTAAVVGYAGAAAVTALAAPALPVITDWGPGDGLTRYVLTATSGAASAELLAGLEAVDGVVSAQALSDGRALIAADSALPQHLTAVPGVSAVEFSPQVPVAATVTDPLFAGYGWHLANTGSNAYGQSPVVADADTDAPDAWDAGTGDGIVVAVVDSGYDSDHPDLAGALWTNPAESCGAVDTDFNGKAGDCHGWNWYTNSADVDNGAYGGHGASVSGTVGARAGNGTGLAGVAPDVTIMPLVIGGGSTVDVLAGAEAIRYAVDHGADVINASWGGAVGGSALTALRSAVAYAAAHDVLVVAAAGNDSGNRDTSLVYPASLSDWNVITVGSSTASDGVSSFSGYGAASVDLFAPGSLVVVTTNSGAYGLANGTSFSSPMVAAAVALYRAAMPTATAAELKQALLDDVDPVPAFAGVSVTGGRLSLAALTGSPAETVRYAFTSMTAPAGVVTPAIGVSGPTAGGAYDVALGLGMEHGGEIWALADKDVTLDGVTVATDDTGAARFALGTFGGFTPDALAPSIELGDGRYVLTVQLYRDGSPVGRTYAAPLLVGSAVPTPGGTAPGGTTPGTTTPGTTPGGTTPGTTTPGTAPALPGTPGGPATPDADPGTDPGDGATDPTDPGVPSDPADPADPSDPSEPGDPATPGTPGTPATPAPGGSTPPPVVRPGGGSTPAPDGTTPGATPATPVPDRTEYDQVGVFKVTSLSPNRVSTAGGTLVTVTGLALPTSPTIRIGASSTATVVVSSATKVVFRVPARTADVYDVSIYAPGGAGQVLSRALTYEDPTTAPTPGDPADDGSATAPDPGDGATPAPGDGTTPAPGGGTAPATAPVIRTGPSGERLVRSATFGALRSIWSVDCSSSCTGVAI